MTKMFKRNTAKKLLYGNETSPCWFCKMPTQYAMTEKSGGEIWCCESCLVKNGRIKRFKIRMKIARVKQEKEKIQSVLSVKNKGNDYVADSLGDKE